MTTSQLDHASGTLPSPWPPDAELSESERAELIRLRAESKNDKSAIAELQMQVEFAKKVATWFAKGKQ